MAQPMQLSPEQMQAVKTTVESEIRRIGLDLKQEISAVTNIALSSLRGTDQRSIRSATESSVLKFLKARDPERHDRVATEIEGRRAWEHLAAAKLQVNVGGQSVSARQAILDCSRIQDRQERLSRFMDITHQIAERFRVREQTVNGKTEVSNAFKVTYGGVRESATDPAAIYDKHKMNCFSGSITLASMIAYTARVAGVEDQVRTGVGMVASHQVSGGAFNDVGHAVTLVLAGDRYHCYDSTNTALPNQGERFSVNIRSGTIKSGGMLPTIYRLSRVLKMGPEVVAAAKFQSRMMDTVLQGRQPSRQDVARISRMDPVMTSYLVNAMSMRQRASFFAGYDISKVGLPGARFKLATTAVTALMEAGDMRQARRYAQEVARSLEMVVRRNMVGTLPLSSAMDGAIAAANLLSRSPSARDRQVFERSIIPNFLAHVATSTNLRAGARTPEELSEARSRAGAALEVMRRHHEANPAMYRKMPPLAQFKVAEAMIRLDNLAHERVNESTERSVASLLSNIGIDYNRLMASLSERDPEAFGRLMSSDSSRYTLLMNTLMVLQRTAANPKTLALIKSEMIGGGSRDLVDSGRMILGALTEHSPGFVQKGSPMEDAIRRARQAMA